MKYLKMAIPPGVKWHGTAYQCSDRWHDCSLVRWDQGNMMPVGGWIRYLDSNGDPVSIGTDQVPREAHSWFLNEGADGNGAGYYMAVATPNALYAMDGTGAVKTLSDGLTLPGSETSSKNRGYGGGKYGMEAYGEPRSTEGQTKIPPTSWTIDNYGEDMIAVSTSDTRLFRWKPDDDRMEVLTNSPRCLSLVATEERFIFALAAERNGTINVRRIAWCDREDPEVWTATSQNEAGGFELQTDGAIRCGIRVRGRTLILTTTDAHVAQYSGPPLVYGFQQVGKNCGVISDRAVAATGAGAFWMGRDGFYAYDGSAVREVPCEVSDKVFRFMDTSFPQNVYAVANAKFNEIVWFYSSRESDGFETTDPDGNPVIKKYNDRYVAYDYAQNIWSMGDLDRHTGVDSGVFDNPIWLDKDGNVYKHEIENAPHGEYRPYAETGPISIGEGDQVIKATQLLSDSIPVGRVTATFKTRFEPQGEEQVHGPYEVEPKTDVRFTGRQMRMRIDVKDSDDGNKDVRIGDMRVGVSGGGIR